MGNFAYIVVRNQHYILKSYYNREIKELEQPILFAGAPKQSGYKDGVRPITINSDTTNNNHHEAIVKYEIYKNHSGNDPRLRKSHLMQRCISTIATTTSVIPRINSDTDSTAQWCSSAS